MFKESAYPFILTPKGRRIKLLGAYMWNHDPYGRGVRESITVFFS